MVDSHCHLDFPDYQEDFSAVLARTQEALEFVINVGTDIHTSQHAVDLSEAHNFIYSAIGIHPHEAGTVNIQTIDRLRTLAAGAKVVAIGECGLDYTKLNLGDAENEKKLQAEAFLVQIELAQSRQLPLVVHCREAYDDLLRILTSISVNWRGVIHCYLGDAETAEQLMSLGFFISFTGIITFKNAAPALLESVKQVPIDKMLLETDAPFLAPVPYRGKRNEPAFVAEVAKKVAEIKGISLGEVDDITTHNVRSLFGIS